MSRPTNSAGNSLHQLAVRVERPFPSHPQVARYFPGASIEEARKRLARAIDRGDGPGLVVGAAGTGKSLLLQVLAAQYHERFDVVLLGCARICTRRALMQAILFELGLPYGTRDEGQLRLGLLDHLLSGDDSSAGLLLLIDESQSLSVALLEELRVLTNIVRGGMPRVRLVLAGSSALEESFANPELESFSQRLTARTYLAPLSRQETVQFIRAQVAAAGAAPDEIFATDALDAIFDATDGVPRLVNQLCDRAVLMADGESRGRVDRDVVQAAWSDLQQLPTPWSAAPTNAAAHAPAVVEFAPLSPTEPSPSISAVDFTEDCEETELDLEDEVVEASTSEPEPIKRPMDRPRPRPADGDPFAEQFDEEEIVLDTFAAWDEVFSSRTPRVENVRDRGFASRVQDALDAVEAAEPSSPEPSEVAPQHGPELEIEDDSRDSGLAIVDADDDNDLREEDEIEGPGVRWPSIRLADVDDFTPLKPIALITPPGGVPKMGSAAFDPVLPEDAASDGFGFDSSLDDALTAHSMSAAGAPPSFIDDDPILVIEEDPAESTGPPVRRENYRQLFSRLRSG